MSIEKYIHEVTFTTFDLQELFEFRCILESRYDVLSMETRQCPLVGDYTYSAKVVRGDLEEVKITLTETLSIDGKKVKIQ